MTGVWLLWQEHDLEAVYRSEEDCRRAAERAVRDWAPAHHWHNASTAQVHTVVGDEYVCIVDGDGECVPTPYSIEFRAWR